MQHKHLISKVFKSITLTVAVLFALVAVPAFAVPSTQIDSGLVGPTGIVLDETNNHLYYLEFTPGNLKRADLSDPTFPVDTLATGLPQPKGLALDLARGLAYVTTDNLSGYPSGTGALWKVELSTGISTLITFNMGLPQQLVLDPTKAFGYTVGYNDGRLRRIDLATGVKTAICTSLIKPMGLVITKDEKFAYVSEQGPPRRISKVDLTTGSILATVTTAFSSPPAFLAWADAGETVLYVAERGTPAQRKVSRVDLATYTKNTAIPGADLPGQPSAMAVRGVGTPVYVTMHLQVRAYDLLDLAGMSGPVFKAVGHVPASAITSEGYADTVGLMSGYFYQVQHCPFGGTVNIFGNFTNFLASASAVGEVAVYYAVIKDDGSTATPLSHTWVVSRWDSVEKKDKPFTIAPALDGYKYLIPVETDGAYHADLWWYPFWIMRWPTGANGQYTFSIKLYDSTGTEITPPPAFTSENSLVLKVDNTPPDVKIDEIWQKKCVGPAQEVQPCQIITEPKNEFYFKITAYDANQHLLNYRLRALWGDNQSDPSIVVDSYSLHVGAAPNYPWAGIFKQLKKETSPWSASMNCAHTFYLTAVKRTIDGYNYILWRHYHKSITIDNVGKLCL
jgi:DNA-binding beta-propeller fold protein YncE